LHGTPRRRCDVGETRPCRSVPFAAPCGGIFLIPTCHQPARPAEYRASGVRRLRVGGRASDFGLRHCLFGTSPYVHCGLRLPLPRPGAPAIAGSSPPPADVEAPSPVPRAASPRRRSPAARCRRPLPLLPTPLGGACAPSPWIAPPPLGLSPFPTRVALFH
jgi:hypothetical protein